MIKIETVDIIRDLIANWVIPMKIKSVVDNGDGTYLINTCNTYHLTSLSENETSNYNITIDGVGYDILEVITDVSILLKGASIPTVGVKNVNNVFFKHGTVTQTNNELTLEQDAFKKTPMVYLKRTFKDSVRRFSSIDRESSITLFFLTQANFDQWDTENFDKYAVKPMRRLVYEFIDMLTKNKNIGDFDSYEIEDAIKFATFATDSGYEKQLFNDTLSGCRLDINLPIRKTYRCTC